MCVHVKHFCLLFNKKLSKSIFNFTACFVLFFVSFDSFVPPTFSVSFFSPLGDKEGQGRSIQLLQKVGERRDFL